MGEFSRLRAGRAAVAVVALYALLLQAFLAAALPSRAVAFAHAGGLCSPVEAERRAGPDAPADERPAACGEACCLAAAPSAPPPPALAAALAVPPPSVKTSPPEGDRRVRPARAGGAVSARGPPTA